MKNSTLILLLFLIKSSFAQESLVTTESIYGGRMNAFATAKIPSSIDSFYVFVTTESANSAFYTKMRIPSSGAATIRNFTKMPGLDASANYGGNIQKIVAHGSSGLMYFIYNNAIYKASTTTAAVSVWRSFGADTTIHDIVMKADRLWMFLKKNTGTTTDNIYYSDVNSMGVATNFVNATNYNTGTGILAKDKMSFANTDSILLLKPGFDPDLTILKNAEDVFPTKALEHDALVGLDASVVWNVAAIAPDGRIFIGGHNNSTGKHIAYKDIGSSTWTSIATGMVGVSGSNIEFYQVPASSNYYVYFGSAYSNNKGALSSWQRIGHVSSQTHSNDGMNHIVGSVLTGGVLLLTTDEGLGLSNTSGQQTTEINTGIEAVQVYDFDMNTAKTHGWLASKAGVRLVSNYNTTSKSWSNAMFPNGDGSPYYSSEMIGNNTSQAYVGNVRVYKTTNSGTNWTRVFTAENAPYNFPDSAAVTSIAVSNTNNNFVMAGYKIRGTKRGGVFYSTDGGVNWNQLLIRATTVGEDVDVNDIELVTDGSSILAYIGVDYDNSVSPPITGMYKAIYNGSSVTVTTEPIYAASSSLITVNDIVIHSKDTIVATGTFYNPSLLKEYGINFHISRTVGGSWTSHVNASLTKGYTACEWKSDTMFYTLGEKVLYARIGFNSTGSYFITTEANYYTAPTGTEINILYYDELLVGTSFGFTSVKGGTTLLPLNLTQFTAVAQTNGHFIQWVNSTDSDIKMYHLQQSCNGIQFSNVYTVASNGKNTYNTLQKNNCSTASFYRLQVVHTNGSYEYSAIVKIVQEQVATIQLYPNPVYNNTLYLQGTIAGIATIMVQNGNGKNVFTQNKIIQGQTAIQLPTLPKGIYFMQILYNGGSVYKSFVVQ
jgi:hypothetical protein